MSWIFSVELSEDWSSVREPVIEGVPFYVKYLGSSLVQKASGEEATADAIKTIIAMVSKPNGTREAHSSISVSDTRIH